MKQRTAQKIIIAIMAVVVVTLLAYFLRDIVFPLIRMELRKDTAGAQRLLQERGILGCITVSLVEALQMVVVFIPAEFIQLSSAMSYPWWLALILCDLGVVIGATIIYFTVQVFRFDGVFLRQKSRIRQIERMNKQSSTVALMYLLFITPIVPFGAICYYGVGKKIDYSKYILTCATGVLPSIGTSILMGTAIREFILNSLPLWVLITIIVCAAAILLVLLIAVMNRYFFKQSVGTPDYFMHGVTTRIMQLMSLGFRVNLQGEEPVREIEGPYLLLANHHCFYDFEFVRQIDPERSVCPIMSRYYKQIPVLGRRGEKYGYVFKKIFDNDMSAIRGILKMKEKGYPVVIFPEARLSLDGRGGVISPGTASLAKKLGVPLVLVQIRKAYFRKPKWRAKSFRGDVDVEVKRIVQPEELARLSRQELLDIINENLLFDEFDYPVGDVFRSRNKAKGLENVLYRCPHCRSFYSNRSEGNDLICSVCGKTYHIRNDYRFDDPEIPHLGVYYDRMMELEREELDSFSLEIPVETKILAKDRKDNREERGTFRMDKNGVSYESESGETAFSYSVQELEGIAFSVNEEFEMYWHDELYYFYPPKENRAICTRVAAVFEMLKRDSYKKEA